MPVVKWTLLQSNPGNFASGMWLMQDGSVLANLYGTKQLVALLPDEKGSYVTGSWNPVGNFNRAKLYYASAVLSDGRLVACGGEYSGKNLGDDETRICEIYDPFQGGQASEFPHPDNWSHIGDSPSVVLNDGTYMLGSQYEYPNVALLNSSTLTWTFGGAGDGYDENTWVLLQTGSVITWSCIDLTTKRCDTGANGFVPDQPLPVMLGHPSATTETGPGICLMNGDVICFGATGHTCIYTPGGQGQDGTWVQGPDIPMYSVDGEHQLAGADVGAILEPNGKVLLLGLGLDEGPPAFVEYDPDQNSFGMPLTGAPSIGACNECRMLLLPNGHGLISFSTGDWYDLKFDSGGDASWAPTITSFPATVTLGSTVTLAGNQLCGLSECQSFGDDNQQAENYPMVRFVDSDGNVTYARAHDVSTRSIAPGEPGTVLVDIPGLALGTYSVYVVAMGIPSQGWSVEVMPPSHPDQCHTLLAGIESLMRTLSPALIPIAVKKLFRRELLGCESVLGAAEVNALIAELFPAQPPGKLPLGTT